MIKCLKQGKAAAIRVEDVAKVRVTVEGMIKDVEARGDAAVREFSRQFDSWEPVDFRLSHPANQPQRALHRRPVGG